MLSVDPECNLGCRSSCWTLGTQICLPFASRNMKFDFTSSACWGDFSRDRRFGDDSLRFPSRMLVPGWFLLSTFPGGVGGGGGGGGYGGGIRPVPLFLGSETVSSCPWLQLRFFGGAEEDRSEPCRLVTTCAGMAPEESTAIRGCLGLHRALCVTVEGSVVPWE